MKFNILAFAILCGIFTQNVQGQGEPTPSFVDPHVVLQERFEGWGTSMAWWAEMLGGMTDDVVEHVVDALFSPSKLNLNILRYVIGGTTPDNYTCGDYRTGSATESFKDGPDEPYQWDRDLRQRLILQLAIEKGADIFEAFSNSPPQWQTISGCSKGNDRGAPLHGNFDAANADQFADYATEVVKYFHEELNITFNSYSPFNEPFGLHGIGSWAGSLSSQEGCNMDRETMTAVIKSVHDAIVAKDLNFLKLSVSEETQVNTQIQSYDYFVEAGVSNLFQQVNVHGYWDNIELSRKDLLSMRCSKGGHDLWMDEMGWEGTPLDDMGQGLNIANRIVLDLRNMMPKAWVYWQIVEGVGQWGVIEIPYMFNATLEEVVYKSGYYAMEQFSQHIRRGSKLVHVTDVNSVASVNTDDGKLVIVAVNPGEEEITHEYDLGLFNTLGSIELFRTSPSEQHLNLPPPTINAENKVVLTSPPQSVSTLVVSNIDIPTPTNLLQNGDFESVDYINGTAVPTSWTLEGERIYDSVTQDIAWRGVFSGALHTVQDPATSLVQNVTVQGSGACSLYLSAWCSSIQGGTKLGVLINGVQGPTVDIKVNGAFVSYGIAFSANAGDTVSVYYENTGTLFASIDRIDNVSLNQKCSA